MRRWWGIRARGSLGVAILLALAGFGPGCTRRGQEAASAARDSSGTGAWAVEIGARGGFTGGGSGHLILADGSVSEWSQITPGDSLTRQPLGRADPDSLEALHQALLAPELDALRFEAHGNMTAFLIWRRAGAERRWSWPEGGRHPELPAPLQRAHDAAQAAVRSARR